MSNLLSMLGGTVRIHNCNVMDAHAVWPHGVDLCVTRFPIRKRDGYTPELITEFSKKLHAVMKVNGIVFLLCYAPTECKYRPFEVAKAMVDAGFNHVDNIVIQKSWLPGKRSENMLVNSHEYVLQFCKGDAWNLDRVPIKEYLQLDSSISCPGNTWKVETGSLDESIPLDLATLLIRITDMLPGSVVFDPFMGTQSTFKASQHLGFSFYGFESDNKRYMKYNSVLKQ